MQISKKKKNKTLAIQDGLKKNDNKPQHRIIVCLIKIICYSLGKGDSFLKNPSGDVAFY